MGCSKFVVQLGLYQGVRWSLSHSVSGVHLNRWKSRHYREVHLDLVQQAQGSAQVVQVAQG